MVRQVADIPLWRFSSGEDGRSEGCHVEQTRPWSLIGLVPTAPCAHDRNLTSSSIIITIAQLHSAHREHAAIDNNRVIARQADRTCLPNPPSSLRPGFLDSWTTPVSSTNHGARAATENFRMDIRM